MGTNVQPSDISIADALFSRVKQRVLAMLYGNPDQSYYANEIIRQVGMGSGVVQRELEQLSSAGLLTVTRRGNQKHYQANQASPVFVDLRNLVLKTTGVVDVLRVALEPVVTQVEAAFVFGSIAKQQDTSSSDVDLMIISESLTHSDVFTLLESATRELGREVNPSVYTPQEMKKRVKEGNAFMKRVLEQPKLWIVGDDGVISA